MRALHIPPNTPTPTPTKSLHAFVPVSSFGSSPPLRTSFSLCGGPATEQAATCDWVDATGSDHYVCHVAGRGHSDHGCILAVILSLCGGPATEQANKSGGTLATIQSIRNSAEESHIVVKDEHHCCRALLFASHAIVRSGSNGKQRWQP